MRNWENYQAEKEKRQQMFYVIACLVFTILFFFVAFSHAEEVDMKKIMMIESSGCKQIKGTFEDARGCFQITAICLKDYNNFHPRDQYSMDDLWNASVSTYIADWYLNKRIPQMLAHYKIDDNVRNRLIAYNAGIKTLVDNKPLSLITQRYIEKYYGK